MAGRRGRPPVSADKAKADHVQVRLEVAEKEAFRRAAEIAGLALSGWIRERLRRAAKKELDEAGEPVAFLKKPLPKGSNGR